MCKGGYSEPKSLEDLEQEKEVEAPQQVEEVKEEELQTGNE